MLRWNKTLIHLNYPFIMEMSKDPHNQNILMKILSKLNQRGKYQHLKSPFSFVSDWSIPERAIPMNKEMEDTSQISLLDCIEDDSNFEEAITTYTDI